MPQKRIVCATCKKGSMVWIGLGQDIVECPKCGRETPLNLPAQTKSVSRQKTKPRKTPKKRNISKKSSTVITPGKQLVPTPQMNRLKNLLDEIASDISRNSVLAPLKTANLHHKKLTYIQLKAFHQHVIDLMSQSQRSIDELMKLRRETMNELTSQKDSLKMEGMVLRNMRKLSQSLAKEPTTEKSIRYLQSLNDDLYNKSNAFSRILLELKPLEKKINIALKTPAAMKWNSTPSMTLAQLEKERISVKPVSKPSLRNETSKKTTSSNRRSANNSELQKLDLLKSHYPDLAKELLDFHRLRKSSKEEVLRSATGVWFLGQAWLVFLDGAEIDLTDDVGIHNLISEMARKAPRCSVEYEASIFMRNVALTMTQFEMRLGLLIAVKKLGHGLIMNGNYDETLALLIRNRDRFNFDMIGQ